jgi:hypothetical protein
MKSSQPNKSAHHRQNQDFLEILPEARDLFFPIVGVDVENLFICFGFFFCMSQEPASERFQRRKRKKRLTRRRFSHAA